MDIEIEKHISRIRDLNDAFRRTFQGGRVMITSGVAELPDGIRVKALYSVASFDQFSDANDPVR
jgi:hypothetical protein